MTHCFVLLLSNVFGKPVGGSPEPLRSGKAASVPLERPFDESTAQSKGCRVKRAGPQRGSPKGWPLSDQTGLPVTASRCAAAAQAGKHFDPCAAQGKKQERVSPWLTRRHPPTYLETLCGRVRLIQSSVCLE